MIHRYKTITKLILSTLVLGFMAITPAKAQFGDIGAFLEAGANDASILTREYIKPFPTGFGTGLNAQKWWCAFPYWMSWKSLRLLSYNLDQ